MDTYYWKDFPFADLKGMVLTSVEKGDDYITFKTAEKEFHMYHSQDCCEHVYIESIVGDTEDLIGEPILVAEEVVTAGPTGEYGDSSTHIFYKLDTRKGGVTIRWIGSSNGYYGEGVDFREKPVGE